jgi:peptide/nickel transport system permease protein
MTTIASGPLIDEKPREGSRVLRRFLKKRSALVAGGFVLFFVIVALAAPLVAPYDPLKTNFLAIRQSPSWAHLLGTDEVGRDLLSRLIWGARASLFAGIIPVCIALAISIPFGLLSGFAGGWTDALIMRFTDAMLSIPFLVIAIALSAVLGPSLGNAMIAIGIAALPLFLRLARGAVLAVRNEDYIEAARAGGASSLRIAFRHILPNIVPPMLIQASLTMASAIIAEASLSFLGLGQRPPAPSWGIMLNEAQRYLTSAPLMAVWPGLAIFCVVISINLLGDALRDALDPKDR